MAQEHDGSMEAEFEKLGESMRKIPEAQRPEAVAFIKGALAALAMMNGGETNG